MSRLWLPALARMRHSGHVPSVPVGDVQTVSYTPDTTTEFMNPERGWHKNETFLDINGGAGGSFGYVRTSYGMTLNRSYVRLTTTRRKTSHNRS